MGDLPKHNVKGWELVEYDGVNNHERFVYEHPKHGAAIVVRSPRGSVRVQADRNPRPEPMHQRSEAWRSWR